MKSIMNFKSIAKQICPPFVLALRQKFKKRALVARATNASGQDLDMYWDADFAAVLETWGEGNAWNEIQLLMSARKGKVLDIACGTGKTMEILSEFSKLKLFGCDISDLLIAKAVERGIRQENLRVCDATQLPYQDDEFDYAFSIGSLEHFTEDGIEKFLRECHRTVGGTSFHQHPTSRSGNNEGWVTSTQSYHNNSVEWWLEKYQRVYGSVQVLDSVWEDEISLGKWFVCEK
jgi:ubiquinone/menaquinone biosynthesis C-methylase UbiE